MATPDRVDSTVPTVYQGPGGIYFVSSEQFSDSTPRRYTVRTFDLASGEGDSAQSAEH